MKMEPENVRSVALLGSSHDQATSLLFQCAVHLAEQGRKVLYISPSALMSFPPLLHGMPSPSSSSLNHLRFMYLPRCEDVFKHIYSIHQHAHVPNVVIVDDLSYYCKLPSKKEGVDKFEEKMHAALVFASFLDAVSVCGMYTHQPAMFIASLNNTSSYLVDIFFSDKVWLMEHDKSESSVSLRNLVVLPEHEKTVKMEIQASSSDFLVLKEILQICYNYIKL